MADDAKPAGDTTTTETNGGPSGPVVGIFDAEIDAGVFDNAVSCGIALPMRVIQNPHGDGLRFDDVVDANGDDVCTFYGAARREGAIALFVAAPDLLASCKKLVSQVRKSGAIDDHGHPIASLRALSDAEASIAKAEGGAGTTS